MREFVDDGNGRLSRQHRVEVQFLHVDAAVRDAPAGDDLESADLRLGVGAAVRLDKRDDHVEAPLAEQVRVAQHQVGLAHAGRRPDVHAQSGPVPVLQAGQQAVRRRGRRLG